MPVDISQILDDLRAEHADLDTLVADADLSTPTPATGWSVGDTVGHLWFFDREATRALTTPDDFVAGVQQAMASPEEFLALPEKEARALGDRLPAVWRETRADLLAALSAADPSSKVPWYGPPMSPASFATARLMEYWAHGQDIADGLGVTRTPTARLRHICHLGVRTRGFSYAVRGRQAPAVDVHVALVAPDGSTWEWGDASSPDKVEGTALDFCLVVTQRRTLEDTALRVTGDDAKDWMSLAQAFAGPPTLTDPQRAGLPTQ
ncbi:MAG TPA: TIGR03084 family metal-binding protein [Mycobacteriales bacterium]|nr:TIGR03084 family metal-binding protein [Mycobacteriales bacterium]